MAFTNTDYLYQNLPSRFRREDKDLFLKRYLQWFGETLDDYDAAFDSFFGSIESATADERWIEFWLENLFGWSWFPEWFTASEKRRLYADFGKHLARRGTRRGIELWLLDFGIIARVHTRTLPWGEFVWGETHYAISEPLHLIVEILFIQSAQADLHVWGEGAWGEFYYTAPKPVYSREEIMDLIRFVQPHAQEILLLLQNAGQNDTGAERWAEPLGIPTSFGVEIVPIKREPLGIPANFRVEIIPIKYEPLGIPTNFRVEIIPVRN